jgi:hypothetical protein
MHRATWWITAIVVWGVWSAQTDCFPLNENQARPSWYVYGWPICIATSGRGRFNFVNFDAVALLVDITISLLIVSCTIVTAELLRRRLPRLAIIDMLAITAGFAMVFLFWSGGLNLLWAWVCSADLPEPTISASAGDLQSASRLSPFTTVPLSLGLLCVGFVLVAAPQLWFGIFARRKRKSFGIR